MRVRAGTADLHHRAGLALSGQGIGLDLPGDRRGMLQCLVEGVVEDIEPGIGGAWVSRAQRVELPDGSVGVDHDEGARRQAEPLHPAMPGESEPRCTVTPGEDRLDHLSEQANPGLLLGGAVPSLEQRDQPVGVLPGRWRATPVRVRQQEIDHRGLVFQQGLVGGRGIVAHVDGAQDAAVDLAESGCGEAEETVGDVVEAVAAAGVAAMASGGFDVAI